MERAGRILSRLRSASGTLTATQLAASAWPAAVGYRIASRTRVTSFEKGRMVVEAEDALWKQNLEALSPQILSNLRKHLLEAAPLTIEFRVGARRRPPQREEPVQGTGLFTTEPSGIADPSLDYIYRLSRRKAGA
jgi:predicted nucleic acid-binding Zn ribbon protein